jgi:predicted lipoprotein with Yx(FWY)xxD motif
MRTIPHSRPALALLVAALFAGVATLVVVHAASAARAAVQVKVEKTAVGLILADARGRTLYTFSRDTRGTSSCYGACVGFWPPLLAASKHVLGSGVKASLLGTTKRKGGALQITYAGHPLYTFVRDTKAGQTNGQGLNEVGGLWWSISPSGALDKKKAAAAAPGATTPTTTTTPGYGYGNGYR